MPKEGYNSNFDTIEPWIYIAFIPLGGVCSYIIVNKALQHYDTIYIVPLFKIGDLMHHILSGSIFLQEFNDYEGSELVFFLIGVVICASGVFLLIFGNDRNEKEKQTKSFKTENRLKSNNFESTLELKRNLQ